MIRVFWPITGYYRSSQDRPVSHPRHTLRHLVGIIIVSTKTPVWPWPGPDKIVSLYTPIDMYTMIFLIPMLNLATLDLKSTVPLYVWKLICLQLQHNDRQNGNRIANKTFCRDRCFTMSLVFFLNDKATTKANLFTRPCTKSCDTLPGVVTLKLMTVLFSLKILLHLVF